MSLRTKKAKIEVFNLNIVQVRDKEVALGFPKPICPFPNTTNMHETDIFIIKLESPLEAERAAMILRDWLKAHLEDFGCVFEQL